MAANDKKIKKNSSVDKNKASKETAKTGFLFDFEEVEQDQISHKEEKSRRAGANGSSVEFPVSEEDKEPVGVQGGNEETKVDGSGQDAGLNDEGASEGDGTAMANGQKSLFGLPSGDHDDSGKKEAGQEEPGGNYSSEEPEVQPQTGDEESDGNLDAAVGQSGEENAADDEVGQVSEDVAAGFSEGSSQAGDPLAVVEQALSTPEENGEQLTLAYFASRAYLEYAISVVKGRALPDVADGQKPVQRRILYAMRRMGLTHDSKQVKSARIVGDVLGKYHPHGDSAAYEAMVRMAQDFTLRYPLVDGQGNFGSSDGDGAAHMRYTEARLSKYADLLLEELDQGSTRFVPNYDGAFKEPVLLPARLPILLLNGASGIAVGMATEIPSHNMREVAEAVVLLINKPEATLDEVLEVLPGPDFPSGAQIISPPREIRNAYLTGYGSLQLRARYHFEELARGQWQLVVTELPYKVGAQKVLSEIDAITNPKAPTGKKITSKQQAEKALMLSMLDAVRDESDKKNPVRLVFEPKSKTVDREEFVTTLLAKSSLEFGCKFNTVSIGIDGKPRQKGIIEILSEWIEFRLKTVTRRLQTKLDGLQDRIHVLEGRLLIILNLDDVIRIIREADDPKAELMKRYGLSDEQAEDILEIKLRQLANLDEIKLQKEADKLRQEVLSVTAILQSEVKLRRLVASEVKADAKKYGDDRRTLVEEASSAVVTQKVVDEPVTVVISEKGFVRTRGGHNTDVASMSFKLGDKLCQSFECRSVDSLLVLTETGRTYTISVSQLPSGRGEGTHISAFIQLQPEDKPVGYFAGEGSTKLLLASSDGFGFVCTASDMITRNKAGRTFFSLAEGEKAIALKSYTPIQCWIATISDAGRFLVFGMDEIRELSNGGKGVTLMQLSEGEKLVSALPITPNGVVVCGIGRGNKAQEQVFGARLIEDYRAKRARKGKLLNIKWKFTELQPSKLDAKISAQKASTEARREYKGLTPEEVKALLGKTGGEDDEGPNSPSGGILM